MCYRRLCHFYKLRNDHRPWYLYSEIPQECTLHYNLRRPDLSEPNVKSTNRFSHTDFQNCMRQWHQLDGTISPTISVFKRELVHLVKSFKEFNFGIHGIEGIRLLTHLRVEFSDFREHKLKHKFQCSAKLGFRSMNTTSCTAHATVIIAETSLAVF